MDFWVFSMKPLANQAFKVPIMQENIYVKEVWCECVVLQYFYFLPYGSGVIEIHEWLFVYLSISHMSSLSIHGSMWFKFPNPLWIIQKWFPSCRLKVENLKLSCMGFFFGIVYG